MKLRVGLVGFGEDWERRHRPALVALADRFEVRAVCDQVAHRAEQVAAQFEASLVDGYRALAEREDVDAVLLLSPQWFGPLPIYSACEFQKAIYLGTGWQLDGEGAQQLKHRVETSGVAFMAEFPRRLSPATLRLKELIATRLGPPELLFCHRRLPVPEPVDDSRATATDSPECREMVDLVDWCGYVVGKRPRWVTGMSHRAAHAWHGQDYRMLSLDFSDGDDCGTGPVAQVSCGRYIPASWQEATTYRPLAALQVSCQRGIAFVDLPSTLIWFDDAGRHQESLESDRPVGEQSLTHFHHAVTSLVSKTASLDDVCHAVNIVQKAEQSHREGRRIDLGL